MTECLRFLRLGVINVLGVTVPGVLLLVFVIVGFLFPLAICVLPACHALIGSDNGVTWQQTAAFWESNKVVLLSLGVIMAYVAGYVVRLSTPDVLDKISAGIVLKKMDENMSDVAGSTARPGCLGRLLAWGSQVVRSCLGRKAPEEETHGKAAKADQWPFQGEPNDKYPYFHFKDYLLSRGLTECADLVVWGSPDREDQGKRSKTHVNMMKLEVLAKSPELSAVLESNEAHVRLMFGTWVSVMTCRMLVVCGATLTILSLAIKRLTKADVSPPYVTSLILCLALLMAMHWAKTKIEHLFHYQRVRELLHIVACAHYARQDQKARKAGTCATPLPPSLGTRGDSAI